MKWKKGDFATSPSKVAEWGIGIVIEDQREPSVRVFFEHTSSVKKILSDWLEPVENPGDSSTYLENALVEEDSATAKDRIPFPQIIERFLDLFPGGFRGPKLLAVERDYKVEASKYGQQYLSADSWEALLTEHEYDELTTRVKRFYQKTNLLSQFEMIKLGEAFKEKSSAEIILQELYRLCYSGDSLQHRLEQTAKTLENFELAKWPVVTYPLFMLFPEKYMFVKPEMTKLAALNRGFDIQYSSQVNWRTYDLVLKLSQDLKTRLASGSNDDLTPRDMIDVQSFMWCTYGN